MGVESKLNTEGLLPWVTLRMSEVCSKTGFLDFIIEISYALLPKQSTRILFSLRMGVFSDVTFETLGLHAFMAFEYPCQI